MAAKIKKGDNVVVIAGRDKGRKGQVKVVMPRENRAIVAGVNMVKRHTKTDRADRRRHHIQRGVDRPVEPRGRRSQGRQADPRRVQDSRRRPQGPLRQAFRRSDRWLRQNRQGRQARQGRQGAASRPPRAKRRAPEGRQPEGRQAGAKGKGKAAAERAAVKAKRAGAPKDYVARLKKLYDDEIVPKLVKEFGYKNKLEVPKLEKIVLNMGVGEAVNDTKKVTSAAADLALIAGQKPVSRARARRSRPSRCARTCRSARR